MPVYTEGWLLQPHGPDNQHTRVTYVVTLNPLGEIPPAALASVVGRMGTLVTTLNHVRRGETSVDTAYGDVELDRCSRQSCWGHASLGL